MKRMISIGDLKKMLREALLREDDSAELKEDGNDSLDSQVDRFLGQYEGEAKSAKAEGRDFRMLTRRILNEAGEDEDEGGDDEDAGADDAGDDAADAGEPAKMSMDDIDIDSFANSVVRLVENYDSLLEVRSTLARRAINFISKSYEPEVVEALKQVLRDDHGLIPGESEETMDDERFPAPGADRAGDGGGGAGGGAA